MNKIIRNTLSEKYDDSVKQTIILIERDFQLNNEVFLNEIKTRLSEIKLLFEETINFYFKNGKASMKDEKYDIFTEEYFDQLTWNFSQFKEDYDYCVEIDYLILFAVKIVKIILELAIQEKDKFLEIACEQAIGELSNRKDQFTCSF